MDTMPAAQTGRPRYLSTAETATLVRQQLKACFPGVTFSVRSNTYSGGSSIRVRWTDGPTEAAVDAAVGGYQGATFDGMTDMKSYNDPVMVAWAPDSAEAARYGPAELVKMGADFIFTDRDLSPQFRAVLSEYATKIVMEQAGREFAVEAFYTEGFVTEWGVIPGYYNGETLLWHLAKHIAPPAPEPKKAQARRRKAA